MSTTRINTSLTEPGMIVAEDIYTSSGQLIIGVGTALTDRMITRMKFYSISDILIRKDDETEPDTAEEKEQLPAETFIDTPYIAKLKRSTEYHQFSQSFVSSVTNSKKNLDSIVKHPGQLPDTVAMVQDVTTVFRSCNYPGELFDMMMCIRDMDDATYIHSMNVALLCNLFGVWLKLPQEDCDNLILAGLLHDIGKIKMPRDILLKPGKLTSEEYTIIKKHTIQGFNLLKPLSLDPKVKLAVLMHHERCDGAGYPMGLKSDDIDSFAKIVAIADVYDAMTATRVYRGPVCPLEVIGIFETEGLQKYDPEYLLTFLENIMHTYLHHTVVLSTGEKAEIVFTNRGALSRPTVRTENNQFIDLVKSPEISIVSVL